MPHYKTGDAVETVCVFCENPFTRIYPGKGRPHGHACPSCRNPRSARPHVGDILRATCKDCGQVFEFPCRRGGNPQRCPDCRPTPVGSIIPAVCQICQQEFEYTFRTYYHHICPGCHQSQKREYFRDWARAHRGSLPRGSSITSHCTQCGDQFQYQVYKRRRRLCNDCLALQNLVTLERQNRAGAWNRNRWLRTREAFGFRCAYCGCKPDQLQRDHFIPRSLGGYSDIGNIAPSCDQCNYHKHAKHPKDYFPPDLYQSVANTLRDLVDR